MRLIKVNIDMKEILMITPSVKKTRGSWNNETVVLNNVTTISSHNDILISNTFAGYLICFNFMGKTSHTWYYSKEQYNEYLADLQRLDLMAIKMPERRF